MEYAITVDPGKFATKCLGRSKIDRKDKQVYFETKYYDLADGDVEIDSNSHLVEYEGRRIILGAQGEVYDTDTTKTSPLHKWCTLTSIASIVQEDRNPSVILTIGCPTTVFKSKDKKEEYREFITSNPNVVINGAEYKINFKRTIVKCEGSGISYIESAIFKDQRVAVIDIGGRNMNFGIYDKRAPVPSSLFSNNYGSTFLETMVRESLNMYLGEDCDMVIAKKAIKDGGITINGKLDEQSAYIVQATIERYVNDYILKSISEKNISLKLMLVLAVGGTSSLVIDSLKKSIPHVEKSNTYDPQWTNVTGFHTVCLVKAGML